MVIGGMAVGFHGHVRATHVDVVPALTEESLRKLVRVLERLEAVVEGADEFEAGELPDPLDPQALALGGNWVLLTRLGRLDLMQWLGDAHFGRSSRLLRSRSKLGTSRSSS